MFIGLPGGIDGLVHLSDLSWNEPGEEAVRKYKKGDEVEAMVLAIDTDRERISLGIKQLGGDPFSSFAGTHEKGTLVKGTVKAVDAKGATIDLGDDTEGYLRASEISSERVEDATTQLKVGDTVEALIISVDRKNRLTASTATLPPVPPTLVLCSRLSLNRSNQGGVYAGSYQV